MKLSIEQFAKCKHVLDGHIMWRVQGDDVLIKLIAPSKILKEFITNFK